MSDKSKYIIKRISEIFPGLVAWAFIISPFILAFKSPVILTIFIIAYNLLWLSRLFRYIYYLYRGYQRMLLLTGVNYQSILAHWGDYESLTGYQARLTNLKNQLQSTGIKRDIFKYQKLIEVSSVKDTDLDYLKPQSIYHVVLIPCYNESYEILLESFESLSKVNYDLKKIIVILAYEKRGGAEIAQSCQKLLLQYQNKFKKMFVTCHPDNLANEIKGKGPNMVYAMQEALKDKIFSTTPDDRIVVTTLDADHNCDKEYFGSLTLNYCLDKMHDYRSYQPIPLFYNNIWDAPALTRIQAASNSFWVIAESMRPYRLRNFASHAQSLKSLKLADFWSKQTIVEDGHQYWRNYFAFNGNHSVVPLFVPIYQDAVMDETNFKSYISQFYQMRRWAYGVSDFSYLIIESVKNKSIPWSSKLLQIWRLFDGHFSWATSSLFLAFAAQIPLLINPDFGHTILTRELPWIVSRILFFANFGLLIPIYLSIKLLPERPRHRHRFHRFWFAIQWLLSPITTIVFGSFAALNAQTRLMFGRYLEEFNVTNKVRK